MMRAAYNRNGAAAPGSTRFRPMPAPQTVNWDRSSASAEAALRPDRFFRWRCYWDYSGGIAADLFVHLVSWYHHAFDSRRLRR